MKKKMHAKSLEAKYSVVMVIWADAGRLEIQGGAGAVQKKSNHIRFLSRWWRTKKLFKSNFVILSLSEEGKKHSGRFGKEETAQHGQLHLRGWNT